MAKPYLYINVHQTILVTVAAAAVVAYIADFNDVRTDINQAIFGAPPVEVKPVRTGKKRYYTQD